MDMGYLPFYFHGYGIFALLVPGIWDIVYIFRDTVNNRRKQTQSENVLCLLGLRPQTPDPHYPFGVLQSFSKNFCFI